MRTVAPFFVFILVCFLSFQSKAATCETTGNFTWNTSVTSNWSCGRLPQAGDVIVIKHTVQITSQININGSIVRIEVKNGGTLDFSDPGGKLNLPEGSGIIVETGGKITGVNSSNQIRIGNGSADWSCSGTACPFNGPQVIGSSTALPIRLLSFNAEPDAAGVQLEWITGSEENNHYFTIERSVNGSQFDSIGTVAGAGNSLSVLNYSFTDVNPLSGTSYYRLKQTDYDQTVSFSKVVTIQYQGNPEIQVYPNPSPDGIFEVYFSSGNYQMLIINSMGSIIKQETFYFQNGNTHKILIDLSVLPKGIYLVYVSSVNQSYTFRLVY